MQTYQTQSGISITKHTTPMDYAIGLDHLLPALNHHKGAYLCSGYEYPGRYSRWDILVLDPPVEVRSNQRHFIFEPRNDRGKIINAILFECLKTDANIAGITLENGTIEGNVREDSGFYTEENRSKKPSIFSVLRALITEFKTAGPDLGLGLIGAFGYDLIFQFETIDFKHARTGTSDMRLLFFDEIILVDRKKESIDCVTYEFTTQSITTDGIPRPPRDYSLSGLPPHVVIKGDIKSDHKPGEYPAKVEKVRTRMGQGDYFEVVLSQTLSTTYYGTALDLMRKIQRINPSPYEFLIQFMDEQLIGASPEMFIRVEGNQVETCPIAGTIRRGKNALEDAEQIKTLIASHKDEEELTMCTDVDRNDKSRVCAPGSVKVIGRRLIETYTGLFHTVDHVVGQLKDGYDCLDAFLSHMWAVTLTGAPKRAAVQEIENMETSPRAYYGGAIGMLGLNGNINTGIAIRTVHLKNNTASYRVGATLMFDSVPELEEAETIIKATSFFEALKSELASPEPELHVSIANPDLTDRHVVFVDNEDSFVHTLGNYVRQTGAKVTTVRWNFDYTLLDELKPDLVVISPGPGRPAEFRVPELVQELARRRLPGFGVCLGLQGMVEAFGGAVVTLGYPMHGKPSMIHHREQGVFAGLPSPFEAGRYHSLIAQKTTLPDCLSVTAETEDGVIMGIKHNTLPLEAVQFHPESILTAKAGHGLKLIANVVQTLSAQNQIIL